MFAVYDNL